MRPYMSKTVHEVVPNVRVSCLYVRTWRNMVSALPLSNHFITSLRGESMLGESCLCEVEVTVLNLSGFPCAANKSLVRACQNARDGCPRSVNSIASLLQLALGLGCKGWSSGPGAWAMCTPREGSYVGWGRTMRSMRAGWSRSFSCPSCSSWSTSACDGGELSSSRYSPIARKPGERFLAFGRFAPILTRVMIRQRKSQQDAMNVSDPRWLVTVNAIALRCVVIVDVALYLRMTGW